MEHITDLFTPHHRADTFDRYGRVGIRRMLVDDAELRKSYREYCRETGSSEKHGFLDFCEEYMQEQDNVWNSLNDYDNQE